MLTSSGKKSDDEFSFFKIALLGNSYVGKTSMINHYKEKGQPPSPPIPTIAVDIKPIDITLPNSKTIKCFVYDTAGQERFKSMPSGIYKATQGILLIYSVIDRTSFNDIRRWIDEINERTHNIIWFLIANKTDVDMEQRVVSYEEGEQLAKHYGVLFFETSIYDDKRPNHSISVRDIMTKMGVMMVENRKMQILGLY